jgi:hypothetical protein
MKKLTYLEAQQEAHQELMKKMSVLEARVKQLGESGANGRLARIAQ